VGTICVEALAVQASLGTNGHGKEKAEDGGETDHFGGGLEEDRSGFD
jgi:hypothetical protein